MGTITALLTLAGLAACALLPFSAVAQQARPAAASDETGASTSSSAFLTPFPEGDIYKIQVYGDGFAEGLTAGLAEVLGGEQRLQIARKHKTVGALVRPEWEDEIKAEEATRDTVHLAVVMLGLSDRQIIRPAGASRALAIGSDEWRDEYARRFDRLLRMLKKRTSALYVVGQPVLRQPNANTQAEMLSEIMRQRAIAAGAKFIDIHEAFQDDSGGFSQFGPDISGTRVKLRDGDGVTFTNLGNRKLAHFVEREVRRDVDQAVSDRAIPLAGDDAEQKKVNPAKSAAATGGSTGGWKGSVTVGQTKSAVTSQVPVAPTGTDTSGDLKADSSKVTLRAVSATGREEAVTLDIVRPAIPAAVIALVTRREANTDKSAQPGEAVVEDVGGGLTVVNSVSALGDGSAGGTAQRKKAGTQQTAFYTVLVKGDRLQAKPGRADDFTWPRPEALPAPAAAAQPQPATAKAAPAAAPGRQPANKTSAPR